MLVQELGSGLRAGGSRLRDYRVSRFCGIYQGFRAFRVWSLNFLGDIRNVSHNFSEVGPSCCELHIDFLGYVENV